jgi:hypothetical protein
LLAELRADSQVFIEDYITISCWPSKHASKIHEGGPEKMAPETNTLVSRTILTALDSEPSLRLSRCRNA